MRFFGIRSGQSRDIQARLDYLSAACQARNVEWHDLDMDAVDFLNLPQLGAGDMLYQVTRGSRTLERLLVNDQVATFYATPERSLTHQDQEVTFLKEKIPMPKSILYVSRDRGKLDDYLTALGGFPIIVKSLGGTHGVGVMRIDSMPSLLSVLDYIRADARIILRQYVSVKSSERLIVLGDQVIDSYQYELTGSDFRTNVGDEPAVTVKKYSAEIEQTAVRAVRALHYEFGGVDVLIDEAGAHYVIEANVPSCNFGRAQQLTGTDVAGMMVDYLMEKSKQLGG